MNSIIVYNRDDLEKAQKNKIDEIVVVGELATQLKKSKTIATAGSISLGVLTVALGSFNYSTSYWRAIFCSSSTYSSYVWI